MSGHWIEQKKRWRIYFRDRETCVYCLAVRHAGACLTLDHLQSRKHGGVNDAKNLITACYSCNSAKRQLGVPKFLKLLVAAGLDTAEIPHRIKLWTARKLPRLPAGWAVPTGHAEQFGTAPRRTARVANPDECRCPICGCRDLAVEDGRCEICRVPIVDGDGEIIACGKTTLGALVCRVCGEPIAWGAPRYSTPARHAHPHRIGMCGCGAVWRDSENAAGWGNFAYGGK